MKKAKLKSLFLARETVATLQSIDVSDVHGGVANTGCDSACTACPGGTRPKTTLGEPRPGPQITGLPTRPTIDGTSIIR